MSRISDEIIQAEVDRILLILRAKFADCHPLIRRFSNLPQDPGIYALRLGTEILYIGKASNIRMRFQGGHKCLSDALIDGYQAEDLRIAAAPVLDKTLLPHGLKQIEGRLLLIVRPTYNVLYPSREV